MGVLLGAVIVAAPLYATGGGAGEDVSPEDIQVVELEDPAVTCFAYEVEWDPQYNGSRAGMACLPTGDLADGS